MGRSSRRLLWFLSVPARDCWKCLTQFTFHFYAQNHYESNLTYSAKQSIYNVCSRVKGIGVVCDADHSHPLNSEVKNAWLCTSTPTIHLHAVVLISAQGELYLYFNHSMMCFSLTNMSSG
jgi:hypothetical protein